MTKEELFEKGNEAVRDALEDALIIINSKGDALTRKIDSDKMFFSPMIDCSDEDSMIVFDTEEDARKAIEDYLIPQDDSESFISVKISKYDPETGKETSSEVSTDGETLTASKNVETEEYSLEDVFSMLQGDDDKLELDSIDSDVSDVSDETISDEDDAESDDKKKDEDDEKDDSKKEDDKSEKGE